MALTCPTALATTQLDVTADIDNIYIKWEAEKGITYRLIEQGPADNGNWRPVRSLIATNTTMTAAFPLKPDWRLYAVEERGNPLWNLPLLADPESEAALAAESWKERDPSRAALLQKIADQPQAFWITKSQGTEERIQSILALAAQREKVPLLCLYNIPKRDCAGYSGGGAPTPEAYTNWIDTLATTLGEHKAVIILEPDALAHIGASCLLEPEATNRYELMSYAVMTLKSLPNTTLYIDIGHSSWLSIAEAAERLKKAGVEAADGFCLNVSNFQTDASLIKFGNAVSKLLNDKPFVIDSSRNGLGPAKGDLYWCDPDGRALGKRPTADTDEPLLNAYLWIKRPGELDGCKGPAGQFSIEYAEGLASRAAY